MKANTKHIAQYSIRIFLMVFWLYVALGKLWDLPAFHRSLLRQPFPDSWADGRGIHQKRDGTYFIPYRGA